MSSLKSIDSIRFSASRTAMTWMRCAIDFLYLELFFHKHGSMRVHAHNTPVYVLLLLLLLLLNNGIQFAIQTLFKDKVNQFLYKTKIKSSSR